MTSDLPPDAVRANGAEEPRRTPIAAALYAYRRVLIVAGILSGVVNLLMLTGPIFMLQVYDRVLASRSMQTLIALFLLVTVLYGFLALLDLIRSRLLLRMGERVDKEFHGQVFKLVTLAPLYVGKRDDDLLPARDLDQLRQFVSGPGPTVFFDIPWVPFYLAVVFLFHYWLGFAALAGILVLAILAYLNEQLTARPMSEVAKSRMTRNAIASASQRNAEAVVAMGMIANLQRLWELHHAKHLLSTKSTGDASTLLTSTTKAFRLFVQSALLAIGAYLVIVQEATPGVMIASAIIASRALAPIEQAIGQWRNFVASRQSYRRLTVVLENIEDKTIGVELPRPERKLEVENASVVPPGSRNVTVSGVTFALEAGDGLGIIGPSAAGKSSLARAIVGAWPLTRGEIRFDGASFDQWKRENLGQYIGYLPQDIELFSGTIAENISRFAPVRDDAAILEAARLAGVHEMILHLPEGYDTAIGEGGTNLSAGQRQRIGFARAAYGTPFLIVLDEPNSNLDQDGEASLAAGIEALRKKGAIVVVVAHRPSALSAVNMALMMKDGRAIAFGPKDEVLGKVLQKKPTPPNAQIANSAARS